MIKEKRISMKRFTIEDYHILKPYIDISDYHEYNSNPITMLMWDFQYHVYYEIFEHYALVYTQEEGDDIEWLTPYCDKPYRHEALQKMKEYSEQMNVPFVFHSMNQEFKDWMQTNYPLTYFIYQLDGSHDYIYDVEMQRSLTGKKMQKRRNHFHAFEKQYAHRYEFRKVSPLDFDAIRIYLDEWKLSKDVCLYESIDIERQGIERLLQNFELFELDGGVIYIDGKLEAFSLISKLSTDTIQIHVEKANRNIRGLSIAIVKYYLDTLDKNVLYMNREDDMGLEALRKAKHDMHPIKMLPKYSAAYSPLIVRKACDEDEASIRELWSQRFVDEDEESIDYYFKHLYQKETCHLLYHNDHLISMMQLHPKTIMLDDKAISAFFLFGVATNKAYEGCGYMSLLFHTLQKQYASTTFYLLQAYDPKIYYKLGFSEAYFKYRYKLSKDKYDGQGGTLLPCEDASVLQTLYQQFTQKRNGYCIRSIEDYQNLILPSLTYYEEKCYVYIKDGKALGYLFLQEKDHLEVSEIIYQDKDCLYDMLSLLSKSTKKVYVYCDEDMNEKRKTITEMMAYPLLDQKSLFIHERI